MAIRLQGALGGLTLDEIQDQFRVSRSTAERMRTAVDAVFGPLERVDVDDNRGHWRLRSDAVRRLVSVSAGELTELGSAATALERAGLDERAAMLRDLATKLRATMRSESLERIESDVETLVHAEGLATRPGPKQRLDAGILALLREAITTSRVVAFRYLAQSTGRRSRQCVQPYGLLYGNRAFLVGLTDWSDEPRLWRLANMSEVRLTEERFGREPTFDLQRYAGRSFGTFQEEPVEVVLRFDASVARDASAFVFHPDQSVEENADGSLTVCFTAGGIDEMCWHLFTWGGSVTVEQPARLRRRLVEMCGSLAAHHDEQPSHGTHGHPDWTDCPERLVRLMRTRPRLSKSRYIAGTQCHLRLWYESYERDLASAPDDALQAVFDTGHEVGEVACRRYPGGHRVLHDHHHIPQALSETREIIRTDTAPALFEAAFEHEGVLVRADVLERLPAGGWRLIEVESTTRLKDVFILDVAVQIWVLRGAGLDVRDAGVLTLNRGYIYDGERLDLQSLFELHPLFDEACALLDTVGSQVRELQAMLAEPTAPEIAPGEHCFVPYECPFHVHCTRDQFVPDHGIDELPRLSAQRRIELETAGIEEIRDVPADFPLTPLQRIVRRTVRAKRALVHDDLRSVLADVVPPVHYLDFETFAPAIPRFADTRPYDAVPFLFSVHTEYGGSAAEHVDYLHDHDDDPRPRLGERVISALGHEGTICTYSGYERRILRALAEAMPELADALGAIETRLFDLLPVVRNGYYHPRFRGSFSIKSVLPVLVPELGYDDLEIADGQMAAVRYALALSSTDRQERRHIFTDLRAYCARDTLAMVRLRHALALVGPKDSTESPQ